MKDLITFWNIDINLLFILALIGVLKKKKKAKYAVIDEVLLTCLFLLTGMNR